MQPLNVKQRSVCEPCVGPRATLTTFTHSQPEPEAKYDFAALCGAFSVVSSIQRTFALWYTLTRVLFFFLQTHVLSLCKPCQSGTLFSCNYTAIPNKSIQLSSIMVTMLIISLKGSLNCLVLLQHGIWIFHHARFLMGPPRISMITQMGLWKVFIKTRVEDRFPLPQWKT